MKLSDSDFNQIQQHLPTDPTNRVQGRNSFLSNDLLFAACRFESDMLRSSANVSKIEPLSDCHLKIATILSKFPKFVFGSQPLLPNLSTMRLNFKIECQTQ